MEYGRRVVTIHPINIKRIIRKYFGQFYGKIDNLDEMNKFLKNKNFAVADFHWSFAKPYTFSSFCSCFHLNPLHI